MSASTIWKFTHGSNVKAENFESAVLELETIHPNKFWASEITEGTWDVQLSHSVIVYNVSAPTVMEAVRIARWKVYLDKSFKSIAV
jgi:hypothetical protein